MQMIKCIATLCAYFIATSEAVKVEFVPSGYEAGVNPAGFNTWL